MNILFYILAAILVYMITVSLERRNAIIGFGEMSYPNQDENTNPIHNPMPFMYDYKIENNSVCVQLRSVCEANFTIYSSKGHFIQTINSEDSFFSFNLNQFEKGTYKIIITDENHQTETYGMKLENNSCVSIKKLNVNLQK